jgi:hypothetical protein
VKGALMGCPRRIFDQQISALRSHTSFGGENLQTLFIAAISSSYGVKVNVGGDPLS